MNLTDLGPIPSVGSPKTVAISAKRIILTPTSRGVISNSPAQVNFNTFNDLTNDFQYAFEIETKIKIGQNQMSNEYLALDRQLGTAILAVKSKR